MKSIFKSKTFIFLLLTTLLGGVLRFWKLADFPVAPNWDEVSHGVNAYSILLTGKDEWGISFPHIFRAFGDYKLPLYIYLSTIPVWLFGLNVFAVRFISALAGTLAIPGIYLLTREPFTNKDTSKDSPVIPDQIGNLYKDLPLLSALLLAISPWHFFISRPALEANLSLTLIIFGFYFLLRFLKQNQPVIPTAVEGSQTTKKSLSRKISLLPAVLLLGLSLHTYNTARVFVPLMVITTLLIYKEKFLSNIRHSGLDPESIRKQKNLNRFLIRVSQSLRSGMTSNIFALLLVVIFSGLVIFQVFVGEGTARYEKLKILSPAAVFQIGESRANSQLAPLFAKLIHNRPVFFVGTALRNYIGYFTPDFFSQKWGAQFQFAIPDQNLLTLPVFLLAFLGFFSFLRRINPLTNHKIISHSRPDRESIQMNSIKSFQFLYSWLLLSPIAASLTIDPPQALRPNPMIPALIIFAALGFYRLLSLVGSKWKTTISVLLALWISISFGFYLKNYFGDYSQKYSSSWQHSYAEVMDYVKDHQSEYDKIFITKRLGEPHIFYAFYTKLNPELLQLGGDNIRFEKSDWFWTDKIDNIYFVNDWQIPTTGIKTLPLESGGQIPTQRSLLITSPEHVPVNAHVIKTVNFLDGTPAFIITSVP